MLINVEVVCSLRLLSLLFLAVGWSSLVPLFPPGTDEGGATALSVKPASPAPAVNIHALNGKPY